MKRGGGVHTVPNPRGSGWANRITGVVRTGYRTKRQAVASGRILAAALESEHTIHNRDGRIGAKNSYGNDPFPPKDGK